MNTSTNTETITLPVPGPAQEACEASQNTVQDTEYLSLTTTVNNAAGGCTGRYRYV